LTSSCRIVSRILVYLARLYLDGIGAPHDPKQAARWFGLAAQKGKRVTVRLRSGQELTGLVRDTNAKVAVLGALGGREFFDAVVSLEHVEAVLIRTKQ